MSEIQNAIEVKNLKKGFGGRVLFENFIIERLHQNNKEKPGAKLSLLPAFLYLLLYVVD